MLQIWSVPPNVQNRNDISYDTHDQFLFWICSNTLSKYKGSHTIIIYSKIKHKETYFMVYI